MLIFFGTSGDLMYLKHLVTKEGFQSSVVARGELVRADRRIEYFTLRVT